VTQSGADAGVKVYHLRGRVVSTDPADGIVVVDHEAIPGFMDAMTMPYQLKNPAIISELHPGDTITAEVLVSKSSAQTVVLDDIHVIAQAKPGHKAGVLYRVPAHDGRAREFALRGEDANLLHEDGTWKRVAAAGVRGLTRV